MRQLIDRLLGRKQAPKWRMGIGAHQWQPPRVVQPSYDLREEDRALWEAFEKLAATVLAFEGLASYAPLAGEPTAARLKDLDDDVWWSRSTGQLVILAERLWAGFPDPLAFSVLAWDPPSGRLIDLGQFWTLPDTWTRG